MKKCEKAGPPNPLVIRGHFLGTLAQRGLRHIYLWLFWISPRRGGLQTSLPDTGPPAKILEMIPTTIVGNEKATLSEQKVR